MLRIGYGYDIHRLEAGRRLVLGGVAIPYEKGLLGHSDADVVCHAVADALLGALGKGDIGQHFPPSDDRWKDADSLVLLKHVWQIVSQAGGRLVNADVTVVAEAPKLMPYIALMKSNLALGMNSEATRVSVKATTNEGLGPEGRLEGISASAVCLIDVADA
jgi:2-C-methyl-D-erythritol 2,4-cyclodiphosphate synthase